MNLRTALRITQFLVLSLLFSQAASASVTVIQKNVQVPTTGTLAPFNFATDGTNSWGLSQLYDGTNLGVINQNGAASENNSAPVVVSHTEITADLCTLIRKTTVAFSSSSAEFQLVAPVSLNQVYICAITLISTAADAISIVGGLGSTCATGTPLAIVGSTTAASGMDIAANQGWQAGDGGATAYSTTTSGHGVCVLQSGTTKIAGSISYVQSPL